MRRLGGIFSIAIGSVGPFGLRTVEPSYPHYMRQYRYDWQSGRRECQWNGPVWPFQTTQVLQGMGKLCSTIISTRTRYPL